MLRLNRISWGFSLAMLVACGGASTPKPVAPPPPTQAKPVALKPAQKPPKKPEVVEQFAFSASATDATEGQATQRASQRLLVALLDDQSLMNEDPFSDRLTKVVHVPSTDPVTVSSNSDGVTVVLGLRKAQLSLVFDRLFLALSPESAAQEIRLPAWPKALSQAVYGARNARLLASLCERRKLLIEKSECEIPDFREADRELLAITKNIVLKPFYEEGTPTRGGVRLRPLRIVAELSDRTRNAPLGYAPVNIEGAGLKVPVQATTDREGQLKLKWPEELDADANVKVSLNALEMFGPLASDLPEIAVQLVLREVGLSRTALVATSVSPSIKGATPALLGELRSTLTQVVELPPTDEQRLVKTSVTTMNKVTPAIADRLRGELDTIVLFNASSEFASRMGTHRVWYEARGTLKVVDAWTGDLLTEVAAQVTESGVGEPRAEAAALQTLGRELGKKLKSQMENQGAAVAVAP